MIAKTLPTTLQGFFENAWTHAVVEGHPRCITGPGGQCLYRCYDPDGDHAKDNACLIGCSIPEEKYSQDMENNNAYEAVGIAQGSVRTVADHLYQLQRIHDGAWSDQDYLSTVEQKLRAFAVEHYLTIPKPLDIIQGPAIDPETSGGQQ
jgi:hypothetical protein